MNEPAGPQDGAFLRRTALAGGWLTWFLLGATFVGLLGGAHPSDASRDRVAGAAAGLIAILNVPSAVLLVRRIRRNEPARTIVIFTLALVGRIAVAILVLWFIHGIDHHRGP